MPNSLFCNVVIMPNQKRGLFPCADKNYHSIHCTLGYFQTSHKMLLKQSHLNGIWQKGLENINISAMCTPQYFKGGHQMFLSLKYLVGAPYLQHRGAKFFLKIGNFLRGS